MAIVNLNLDTALRERPPPPWPARPGVTPYRPRDPLPPRGPKPLVWYHRVDPMMLLASIAAAVFGPMLVIAVLTGGSP